jgi:hypothetical protein
MTSPPIAALTLGIRQHVPNPVQRVSSSFVHSIAFDFRLGDRPLTWRTLPPRSFNQSSGADGHLAFRYDRRSPLRDH